MTTITEMNPADVVRRIKEIGNAEHSMTFSAAELSLVTAGLDGLKRAVGRKMRESDPDTIDRLVDMIAAIGVMERRISTVLEAAMTEAFGEDGPPDFEQMISKPTAVKDNSVAEYGGLYL